MNETPKTVIPELQKLLLERIDAKRKEDDAAAIRKDVDSKIAGILRGLDGDANTVSLKLPEVGLKVAATFGVNRKVDNAAVSTKWGEMSPELQACFRFKAEVVEANAKKILESDKAASLAEFITTTPASPSLKIEVL